MGLLQEMIEIYQWLFKKNGFKVSDIGFIIYANGKSNEKEFGGILCLMNTFIL